MPLHTYGRLDVIYVKRHLRDFEIRVPEDNDLMYLKEPIYSKNSRFDSAPDRMEIRQLLARLRAQNPFKLWRSLAGVEKIIYTSTTYPLEESEKYPVSLTWLISGAGHVTRQFCRWFQDSYPYAYSWDKSEVTGKRREASLGSFILQMFNRDHIGEENYFGLRKMVLPEGRQAGRYLYKGDLFEFWGEEIKLNLVDQRRKIMLLQVGEKTKHRIST